jgi:hypothetical protein
MVHAYNRSREAVKSIALGVDTERRGRWIARVRLSLLKVEKRAAGSPLANTPAPNRQTAFSHAPHYIQTTRLHYVLARHVPSALLKFNNV